MKHLFVSPHPDDIALSCGGLVLNLADAGEAVEILTIFSGCGNEPRLTPYQRLALGFGDQDRWEPGRPSGKSAAKTPARTPPPETPPETPAPTPGEIASLRRAEDLAYAQLVGANVSHLDLPDAVFRDYVGDDQLCADSKPGDPAPVGPLAAVLRECGADRVYLPLAVGGHVDHRLTRRAGLALLAGGMLPIESVRFYEDFPYSANLDFAGPDELDDEFVKSLPVGHAIEPELVHVERLLERKISSLAAYPSQLGRLFGGDDPMAVAVRERGRSLGADGSAAERYWRLVRG